MSLRLDRRRQWPSAVPDSRSSSARPVVLQPGDHPIRMSCSGHNGVTIVTQHMGVNRVDLRDLLVKGLGGLVNDELNPANGGWPLSDDMGVGVDDTIKSAAESPGKLVDEGSAAALFRVLHGVSYGIFGSIGQEKHKGSLSIPPCFSAANWTATCLKLMSKQKLCFLVGQADGGARGYCRAT